MAAWPVEVCCHLSRARKNGYYALQGYIAPTDARAAALREIATLLRDRTGRAVTVGFWAALPAPELAAAQGRAALRAASSSSWPEHPERSSIIDGLHETSGLSSTRRRTGDFLSLELHDLPVARVNLSDDPDVGLAERLRRLQLERSAIPDLRGDYVQPKALKETHLELAIVGLGRLKGEHGAPVANQPPVIGCSSRSIGRPTKRTRSLARGWKGGFTPQDVVGMLSAPRIVWLMVPAGDPTEETMNEFAALLQAGDTIVDGGNSNFKDSQAPY